LDEDLLTARWKKLVWNIPFNGLSVVLNATTTEMMADPDARALAEALMREVVADAAACGRQIGKEFVQKMLAYTAKMIPYRTSMKIDYDERRPMEVEAIYGNPLRAAKRAGADSPRLEALYRQLKFMDARNAGLARA
jgi:2-dehydropantoate 2-reductase